MNTEIFISAIVSYLVVVDPLGVALIFQSLTENKNSAYRRIMAIRAVGISLSIVLLVGFFGNSFLNRLGITMESFRIAGGLLLFYTAFRMVTTSDAFAGEKKYSPPADISVFPISFPMIAGPGCLTLTILLFSNSRQSRESPDSGHALCIAPTCFFCDSNNDILDKWDVSMTQK